MKKVFILLALSVITAFAVPTISTADGGDFQRGYPKYQNAGAVDVGTTTSISVTTNPAIIVSTPLANYNYYVQGSSAYGNVGANLGIYQATSTIAQMLDHRLYMEIFNDTTNDIWVGYNISVSTMPGLNYGRRIPAGSSWSHTCSLINHWVVSSATTLQKVVITQER